MTTMARHLETYLQLRRQLGFKLGVPAILLRNFVQFAQEQRATFITTKVALRWATRPANIKPRQRAVRLGVVRRFAEYVSTIDPRTEIPAKKLLPFQYRRPNPYLYRDEEVLQLIEATGQIDESDALKCATYATLFGLLVVTGMRVGEAIALTCKDVDLDQGVLTIPKAKGNKSRLVPLHPSTNQALRRYQGLRERHQPCPSSSSFFISENGTSLRYSTVNRWFLVLSRRIGMRQPDALHGPKLHDLRHRFAIRTLVGWYRSDVAVDTHLPELATYLGHVHVNDTYWYLSAAPELLQQAMLRWQQMEGAQRL
jgi:integrase/recombinase XerD